MALAAVLYVGYNWFISGGAQVLETSPKNSEGEMLTREFLVRLSELEGIDFSRQLFDDPRFRSLTSFSTTPEPVQAGRANPFSR